MARVNKLLIRCMQKGIRLYELAEQIGITDSYLSRVGVGALRMSPDREAKAAEILGTTVEELFGTTDDTPPSEHTA